MATRARRVLYACVLALAACSNGNSMSGGSGIAGVSGLPPSGASVAPPAGATTDPSFATQNGVGALPSGAAGAAAPNAPPLGTQPGTSPSSPATMMATTPSMVPAANDPNTVTIAMDTFTVAAGAEVFMCQDFPNPFGGADVAIGRTVSDMTTGSHHLHVFYGQGSPALPHVQACSDPNEFRSLLHISTLPHFDSQYPAGMAAKLKGTTGLRMQVHYLNVGTTPIEAKVTLAMTKVDPSTVQNWVAQMHFNRVAMSVAPGMNPPLTTTCKIPSTFGPIGILSALSHMHKRGVHFTATTNTGVNLLDTTNWDDPPPTYYQTPVMLNPGDSISWSCTYNNTTGMTLGYGDSAEKNEMCIYIARFFSSPNGDDLQCETPVASSTAMSVPTN